MQFKIFNFKSVTSTNDIAIQLIRKKKNRYGFIFSKNQSKGRGTHGKKWVSESGNLYVSIFFPLRKIYPPYSEFSIINPVIIYNIIKKFCKKNTITFKYPNDILLNKKKVCGILQEVITVDQKKFLITGVGINIISNPDVKNIYKSTNIFLETKQKPNISKMINLIIKSYESFFYDLNMYNFVKFKKQAEFMALK